MKPDIYNRIKSTFSIKQLRITLYIVIVLWVAVGAQMIINQVFHTQVQITEAFVKSDTAKMQSTLQIIAQYDKPTLSEVEKEKIIQSLAQSIGLILVDEITVIKEESRSESFVYKKAKKATTELKVASIEEKESGTSKLSHYIITRLSVSDRIGSIDEYKRKLEKAIKAIGVINLQTTMKYEGSKVGSLTKNQKHEIAQALIKDLQGKIAMEYDEGDMYTVYGYTGMLNDYVKSLGNKINIQIAITYNEMTDKSTITLATPIINDSY